MYQHCRLLAISMSALFLFSSCEKGGDPTYNDRPVVTAYLMAGTTPSVAITRQLSTSAGVAISNEDLDSLQVFLSDDVTTYTLVHEDTAYVNKSVIIQAGKIYNLSFRYNGKDVYASTTIPSKPLAYTQSVTTIGLDKVDSASLAAGPFGGGGGFTMVDPVSLTWTNSDNSYYMMVANDTVSNPELVRDTISGDNRPAFAFRNQPSIIAATELRTQQFEYFGTYRLVLYHLQPEYATLYETASTSSQNLTTPITNVTNGFGIFTGINADTLYLEVTKN